MGNRDRCCCCRRDVSVNTRPRVDEDGKAKANGKLAGWFTGQVMKATGGKVNPAAVDALVKAKLGL